MHDKNHLLALSRVSKLIRSLVFQRVFEVLTIKPFDEASPWDLIYQPFFDSSRIAGSTKLLRTVKELHFSTTFVRSEFAECAHSFNLEPYYSCVETPRLEGAIDMLHDDDAMNVEETLKAENGDYGLMILATNITRLLSALSDEQLTSFRLIRCHEPSNVYLHAH